MNVMTRRWLCLFLLASFAACRSQTPAPAPPPRLPDLKPFVDKLATESALFATDKLGARLQKLLGDAEYRQMVADWQTQTPVEEEGGVFHASGCRAHDCLAINYQLYVEPARDAISVFRLRDQKITPFEEKGPVRLPARLASDFETLKSNFNDSRFR